MLKIISALALSLALFHSRVSHAQAFPAPNYETKSISGGFTVADSQVKSIDLGTVRYVKNIIVQAQGLAFDSTVEVMVNGQVKGTIYAPGRDPSYVVTIAEATSSIEFRHRSGGSLQVLNIIATLSAWSIPGQNSGGGFYGDREQVKQLAMIAIQKIDFLSTLTTLEEQELYLFPIKKKAGLLLVMATAHGNLSRETRIQLLALTYQIDFARPELEMLMQTDLGFESVIDLLTVRETIKDMLD